MLTIILLKFDVITLKFSIICLSPSSTCLGQHYNCRPTRSLQHPRRPLYYHVYRCTRTLYILISYDRSLTVLFVASSHPFRPFLCTNRREGREHACFHQSRRTRRSCIIHVSIPLQSYFNLGPMRLGIGVVTTWKYYDLSRISVCSLTHFGTRYL